MEQEFQLFSAGPVDYHHVMKIPSDRFKLEDLKPPVTLQRHKPEPQPVEQPEEERNIPFKKKTKALFMGRDDEEETSEDKHPWVLKDDDQTEYLGHRETGGSNYVLFVSSDNGFKVIPCSKWYKFTKKLSYRTLTVEEAEERMKEKPSRWMMKDQKSWKQKLLAGESLTDKEKPKIKKEKLENDDGMDFDEVFEDDEEVVLGIEDKEEAKEAERRLLGKAKATFESDDDEEPKKKRVGKSMLKALKKYDQDVLLDDDEDDFNPYGSDDEESDKDEKEAQETVKQLLKKKSLSRSMSPDSMTAIKREGSDAESARKRPRTEGSVPPPPSAAQVIQELERQRRSSLRQTSSSPPPNVVRLPAAPPPPVPQPVAPIEAEDAQGLLQASDVVDFMRQVNGSCTVKEIVAAMRTHLRRDARNKDRLAKFMKQVLKHDKSTGTVTLKTT
ncbi:hypothetical protein EDD86DRAFT_212357 [Gorgonomyces haynaldii]|nr:hypothetical protein EDD86DRAFT_212357 [Gorgonomyces haynaldii]